MSYQYRKGKTPLWKVSQENTKFYSKAQTTRHSEPTSQTSQANVQVPILTNSEAGRYQPPQSTQSISAQPKRADPAVVQAPAQGPANFPLILPSHRQLPGVARLRDKDPLKEDEDSFSIDLEKRLSFERNRLGQKC